MKKIFFFLFVIIALQVQANNPFKTGHYIAPYEYKALWANIYVATTGSDGSGDGTVGNPYRTLTHAASVATSGDVIHLATGTYNEAARVELPVGVSITGSGTSTIITATSVTAGFDCIIRLYSSSVTAGNQRLTNFSINGNSRGNSIGIGVYGRSNVEIDNITGANFDFSLIAMTSQNNVFGNDTETEPSTYAVNNYVHHITATNCSGYENWYGGGFYYGSGQIFIGGQEDMIIENCNLNQTQRTTRHNGWLIKQQRWSKNLTIRNNTLVNNPYPYATNGNNDGTGDYWNFSVEIFNVQGLHIHNNIASGSIDVNRIVKVPAYAYGFYAHDNTIGFDALGTGQENGFILEFDVNTVILERNVYKNITEVISCSPRPGSVIQNLTFNNELCGNIGQVGEPGRGAAFFLHDNGDCTLSNVYFNHCTFIGNASLRPDVGFNCSNVNNGSATNLDFLNCIWQNFNLSAIGSRDGSKITDFNAQNNLFYQNGNGSTGGNIYWGNYSGPNGTPNAPYNISGSIDANPNLNSSYIPNSGSPAINAATDGTDIGWTGGTTAPYVISTNPVNGAIGVPIGNTVVITFNEDLASGTVNSTNCYISGVTSSVTLAGGNAIQINPTTDLSYSTTYNVTITTAVTDAAGNPLASNYTFSFTTQSSGTTTIRNYCCPQ